SGDGGGDGVLPEFAGAQSITGVGRVEEARAADGDDELIDLVESHALDRFEHGLDGRGAGEVGAVGEAQHAGGDRGVEGDQIDDAPGIDVLLPQQGEQLGQDAQGRRQFLDLVYVVVELLHRTNSWGSPEILRRTSPVARLRFMVRLTRPPTCWAWMCRPCSSNRRRSVA